jgi:hypothetical protein
MLHHILNFHAAIALCYAPVTKGNPSTLIRLAKLFNPFVTTTVVDVYQTAVRP